MSQLILQPNRSATWFESKLMIGFMVFVVLTIAIGWLIVGVWMILPFAGIEVGLFALLMYLVSRQTYRQQIIDITLTNITVTNSLGRRNNARTIPRQGSFVEIIETERDWTLPQLFLVNDEKRIAIGQFLNLADRNALREILDDEGLPTCRTHWWKTN